MSRDQAINIHYDDKNISTFDFLSKLYPIKKNSEITPQNHALIINKITRTLKLALQALSFINLRKLFYFDGHIGETSCHIRACNLVAIAKTLDAHQVKKQQKNIQDLITSLNSSKVTSTTTFHKITQKIPHLDLKPFAMYLTQCFVLNKYTLKDEYGFPIRLSHQSLKKDIGTSSKLVKLMLESYQKHIASKSVEFMQDMSEYLDKDLVFLAQLEQAVKHDSINRRTLPTFTTICLANEILTALKIPIVFRVKAAKSNMVFSCTLMQNDEPSLSFENSREQMPCYVIFGITEIQIQNFYEFKKYCSVYLKDLSIIETNGAIHKQYVDNSDFKIPNAYKEIYQKSLASSTQNCLKAFKIQHIYADTLCHATSNNDHKNTNHKSKQTVF